MFKNCWDWVAADREKGEEIAADRCKAETDIFVEYTIAIMGWASGNLAANPNMIEKNWGLFEPRIPQFDTI